MLKKISIMLIMMMLVMTAASAINLQTTIITLNADVPELTPEFSIRFNGSSLDALANVKYNLTEDAHTEDFTLSYTDYRFTQAKNIKVSFAFSSPIQGFYKIDNNVEFNESNTLLFSLPKDFEIQLGLTGKSGTALKQAFRFEWEPNKLLEPGQYRCDIKVTCSVN